MKNKTHTITVRVNDLEYEYIKKLKEYREEIQNDGTEYSASDIMRIALDYMIDIEYWQSKKCTFDTAISKAQQEYAKAYWERKRSE